MHFLKTLFLISLLLSTFYDNPKERSVFISPVKIPIALSANFGELRSDHFHSGLDIKTQGVTGKEVIASASGYVYRISVSPGGFGKTIYMRHPTGYSTVYAHLDMFIPEIEEYVIARQYENKSYLVNLFPPKERFRFDQGDLIAYSGNTGSSTGPHLHYEIRKTEGEFPVNPLLFELGVEDSFKPVIERLVIYPFYGKTLINSRSEPLKINVAGSNGNFYLPPKNVINIAGPAGFGIKSFDLLNNSYNRCAVYSIALRIDSVTLFTYKIDGFSFNETRYINSHIDYEMLIKEKTYVEKLFLMPNNKFSAYQDVIGKGIFNFNDNLKHLVEIIVTDIHNNISTLTFSVNSVMRPHEIREIKQNNSILMPYSRNNRFVTDKVIVSIPAGSLYDTLFFDYKKSGGRTGMYSEIHQIHNMYTPVHRPYSLSIKPDSVRAGRESSMMIVQMTENGRNIPLRSTWNNGYLVANPGVLGSFYVGIDTIPPVILPNGFTDGIDFSGRKEMRFRITDDFSGINSYDPSIDGKWALFEYDQKNSLLIYKFDPKRIKRGTKHKLVLKVTDNAGNMNMLSGSFTW